MDGAEALSRKEKRKALKKNKRKQVRKEIALKEREEEESRLNDPEEQARLEILEKEEAERIERDRKEFEERERRWLEALEMKKKMEAEELEEEERRKAREDSHKHQVEKESDCEDDENWEFVEGPPEIIWQGNEIIVKKKKVKVPKDCGKEDNSRPTSNPLPPQTEAFADYNNASKVSAKQMLENVAQQVPNFGTELDKAHCPFHLKTGACRFGQRCSRAHFYPDKSCTLLIKNMYNGPGITWEQDEGLEKYISRFTLMEVLNVLPWLGVKDTSIYHTDEEVERCFEEFYEDVHTEFLKFGEIVNFKVCRNGAFHLRGNVYVHYKSLDSAVLAYQSINARYFAGKQVSCEFVNVTKWKAAICGDYMKSRFKTCSHGTACNFIHCFRNPGGDYEWADWDKLPPRYWTKKMVALFGYSDESGYEKQMEQEHPRQMSSSRMMTPDVDRHYSKRSRYNDEKIHVKPFNHHSFNPDSDRDWSNRDADKDRVRNKDRHHSRDKKSSRHRHKVSRSPNVDQHSEKETCESDDDGEGSDRDRDKESHHGRTRKGSRKRSRAHHADHDEDRSDRDRDRNRDRDNDKDRHHKHHGTKRSRSRQRREVSRSPKEYSYSKKRTEESDDSGGDWSGRDGDKETSHGRSRKGSSKRGEGGYPDSDSNKRNTRRTDWDQLINEGDEETNHSHEGKSSRHQRKKTQDTDLTEERWDRIEMQHSENDSSVAHDPLLH